MCRFKFGFVFSFVFAKNKLIAYRRFSYSRTKLFKRVFFSGNNFFIGPYMNVVPQCNASKSAVEPVVNLNNSDDAKPPKTKMQTLFKYRVAINHEELISLLNKCSTVNEQIEEMYNFIRITEDDLKERLEIAQNLANILQPYFQNCQVHVIGSSISGFGLKGCDLDLGFFNDWSPTMQKEVSASELPSVEDIDEGRIPLSKVLEFSPRYQLRFVRRVLTKYCPDISSNMIIIHGRCPIVQFQYGPKHINCDISFESGSSRLSTKLLYFISKLDPRIIKLGKIINYWAKHVDLIGPFDKFKSFAFYMLLIYFLQTRNPPVIPPLHDILNKTEFFKSDVFVEFDISKDLEKFPLSQNTQTVSELLREFFFFYLFFDFNHTICPLSGQTIDKHEFQKNISKLELSSTICIQDPLDEAWNITTGTSYKNCRHFMVQVLATCKLYQDSHFSFPVADQKWGLAKIMNTQTVKKELSEDSVVQFFAAKSYTNNAESSDAQFSKLSETILKILNYALLYPCSVISFVNKDSFARDSNYFSNIQFLRNEITGRNKRISDKSYLKVLCSAVNTWQGRCHWNKEEFSLETQSNPLELEHCISKHMIQNSCDGDKKLFEFTCECVAKTVDKEVFLNVLLSPIGSQKKFPSKVAIFLRDYIPKLIEKV